MFRFAFVGPKPMEITKARAALFEALAERAAKHPDPEKKIEVNNALNNTVRLLIKHGKVNT